MEPESALMLTPCAAVHTAFMRFVIDVVFLDREGRAAKIVRDMRPWRLAGAFRAHTVVELAGGRLRSGDVEIGDQLYLAAESDRDSRNTVTATR
jgi:uncharacterized membrane protein (UPF0127 family)